MVSIEVVMFARSSDERPGVHVPAPAEDRPSWAKIGVITLIGFALGVTWPRFVGMRVGPHLPQPSADTSVAAAEGVRPAKAGAPVLQPTSTPGIDSAPHSEPAAFVAPPPSSAVRAAPALSVSVGRGIVTSCRTSEGESLRGADCGRTSSLDRLVAKSLQKLAECPAAAEKPDKFRLVVRADFVKGTLSVLARKGAEAEAAEACARSALEGVNLESVAHVNPRVTVTYPISFTSSTPAPPNPAPPNAAPMNAGPPSERPPAPRAESGNTDRGAQVVWDVALVRDTPRTGRVTSRLKQGTALHVGAAQDGWYPVKFGEAFAEEGWIYGEAIGR